MGSQNKTRCENFLSPSRSHLCARLCLCACARHARPFEDGGDARVSISTGGVMPPRPIAFNYPTLFVGGNSICGRAGCLRLGGGGRGGSNTKCTHTRAHCLSDGVADRASPPPLRKNTENRGPPQRSRAYVGEAWDYFFRRPPPPPSLYFAEATATTTTTTRMRRAAKKSASTRFSIGGGDVHAHTHTRAY